MITGFMAGVALGQKLVGMNKTTKAKNSQSTYLRNAKLAALKRMNAYKQSQALQTIPAASKEQGAGKGKRRQGAPEINAAEELVFDKGFDAEFKGKINDTASGYLLSSVRQSLKEFNDWIKRQTSGLLDLNMSLAIFFLARGIRKFLLEKQYPNAWQLIWWASSILRGWRFM